MCFISNDKRISDNKTFNENSIGLCKMGSVQELLIEQHI